jgi:uncharacterized membrane-anchored protein
MLRGKKKMSRSNTNDQNHSDDVYIEEEEDFDNDMDEFYEEDNDFEQEEIMKTIWMMKMNIENYLQRRNVFVLKT